MAEATQANEAVTDAANKAAAELAARGLGNAPKPPEKPETKYTDADLEQAKKDAVAAAEKKANDKAAKDKEAADKEKAKEEGKFKDLADAAEAKAAKLEAENRSLRLNASLNAHLAEKHKDYIGSAKWILATIPADTADDELPKAIEKAAKDFVEANPRQVAKPNAGAPPVGRISTAPAQRTRQPGGRITIPHRSAAGNF